MKNNKAAARKEAQARAERAYIREAFACVDAGRLASLLRVEGHKLGQILNKGCTFDTVELPTANGFIGISTSVFGTGLAHTDSQGLPVHAIGLSFMIKDDSVTAGYMNSALREIGAMAGFKISGSRKFGGSNLVGGCGYNKNAHIVSAVAKRIVEAFLALPQDEAAELAELIPAAPAKPKTPAKSI